MRIDTHTPHIEPEWAEAFLLELRLRGVEGRRIGSALAEVEAHCAESGESARAAFGEPTAYAAELVPTMHAVSLDARRELVPAALGPGGMLLTLGAVGALRTDADVEVTAGMAGALALVLAGTPLVVSHAEQLLRVVVRRWWVAMVAAVVAIVLVAGILLVGREALFVLPALPVLTAGLVLLTGHTAWAFGTLRHDDRIVGPGGEGGAGTLREGSAERVIERVGPFLFPALTAVMALPLLFL